MHPTIAHMQEVVAHGREEDISPLLAAGVEFLPPTYWKTWTGREPVAAVLGHVGRVFSDFRYRRVMGAGDDAWGEFVTTKAEFQCRVGDLDAVGVDLITLDADGLIARFEVAMRPLKTVSALRDAMNAAVMRDARFLKFRDALS